MYVYKIENIQNGKVYIGQSIRPIYKRFQRHINDALNNILDTHFARAIRKYGKESFTISLIEECKTQEELNIREQYWIRYYNATVDGYNETDATSKCGGNTYQSKSDEELKNISKKIRESKIGRKNPNSKSVKVYNILTNEEIFFDTVLDCQIFFNEATHRFVTTRVLGQTKSLYKKEWKIAYSNEEYREFTVGIHRSKNQQNYLI